MPGRMAHQTKSRVFDEQNHWRARRLRIVEVWAPAQRRERKYTIRHSKAAPSLMCVKHPWVSSAQHALTPLTRSYIFEIGTSSIESEQSPVGVCKPKVTHGPRPLSSRRGTKALIHKFLGGSLITCCRCSSFIYYICARRQIQRPCFSYKIPFQVPSGPASPFLRAFTALVLRTNLNSQQGHFASLWSCGPPFFLVIMIKTKNTPNPYSFGGAKLRTLPKAHSKSGMGRVVFFSTARPQLVGAKAVLCVEYSFSRFSRRRRRR